MLLSIYLPHVKIFAKANNIRFSTDENPLKSKSKAVYVTGQKINSDLPVPLILCDKELPWVDKCEHLGHAFDSTCSMEQDCRNKRSEFIQQVVKVKEQFQFAHTSEIITATDKYCSSHYGHLLWNLRGEAAGMLYASWRTNVKLVWNLPR